MSGNLAVGRAMDCTLYSVRVHMDEVGYSVYFDACWFRVVCYAGSRHTVNDDHFNEERLTGVEA